MKMYFLSIDGKKTGPFSIDEIQKRRVTERHLIWTNGMADWVSVKDYPELKEYILVKPPPTPYDIAKKKNIKTLFNATLLSCLFQILLGINFFIIDGGYLSGETLLQMYRKTQNAILFSDGGDATQFYLILSFLIVPLPFSLIFGFFSFKKISTIPGFFKKAIK